MIEIHLVTRILGQPRNPRYEVNYKNYLEDKAAGVSPWLSCSGKRDNLYYVKYNICRQRATVAATLGLTN